MRVCSVYRLDDGRFTGQTLESSNPAAIDGMKPDGCGIVEGVHDHLSKCVDLSSGSVISLTSDSSERRRHAAMARIIELEQAQHRPLRELSLDPASIRARARLTELDAQIAVARAELKA